MDIISNALSNASPGAGIGAIASQRSYRSRRNRPCDRCRSRKQRCVIPPPSAICLNCSLAGAECTFDEPATKRVRTAPPNPGPAHAHAETHHHHHHHGTAEDLSPNGSATAPAVIVSSAEDARHRAASADPLSGRSTSRPQLDHAGPASVHSGTYDGEGLRPVAGSSRAHHPAISSYAATPSSHVSLMNISPRLVPASVPSMLSHPQAHSPLPHHHRYHPAPASSTAEHPRHASYYDYEARNGAGADHRIGRPASTGRLPAASYHSASSPATDGTLSPDGRYRALPPSSQPAAAHSDPAVSGASTMPPLVQRHTMASVPQRASSTVPSAPSDGSPNGSGSNPQPASAPPTVPSTAASVTSWRDRPHGAAKPNGTPRSSDGGGRMGADEQTWQHQPAHAAAARAASLTEIFSEIVNSSRPMLSAGPDPPTSYRSLDSDAGEDFELHFIGATSERDALVLSAVASLSRTSGAGVASTYRMRQVSEDPAAPVIFLFNPTKTYDEAYIESHLHVRDPLVALEQLLGVGRLPGLIQKFLELDGQAVPLWSDQSVDLSNRTSKSLQACYICTAVIYFPELRSLAPAAWSISVNNIRALPNRARLATIQANLLDLAGRPSVNRRVNLLRLGETVAAARLLALHLDCSRWKIPPWEKRLRTRLWWALLMHDKWLALCHGHSSSISVHEWNVGLPRASASDPPSYRSFILLCELTVLLDEALSTLCSVRTYESDRRRPDWKLAPVADLGRRLDAWRAQMDQLTGVVSISLRAGEAMPPGFHSLRLSFHAVAMLLSRTALDVVTGNEAVTASAVVSAQQGVLQVAEDVVEFVCGLTGPDFAGYWSVYCSAHLSKTLVLLVRLIIQADRTDHSEDAVWTRTLRALERFLGALADAQRDHAWDIADLAIARARDIVPLLMQQIPELEGVLQPLHNIGAPATQTTAADFADTFDLSQVFSGFGEAWDGNQPLQNWYPLIAGGLWHTQGISA